MKILKNILLILILILMTSTTAFAAKIPDGVRDFVKRDFPKTDFRFDGVIILPDGTLYLPLFPALIKKPDSIAIKNTYPAKKALAEKPDIVILNNDFVLMKVLVDQKGRKTVLNLQNPPIEVKTGLLPQEMLVPKGLIIPDNIKGIIGNLQIETAQDAGLRVKPDTAMLKREIVSSKAGPNLVNKVPQIQNKVIYAITCYSKNIHVINGESRYPEYALSQNSIPIDIKTTNDDKFLLVTCFDKTFVNVISLADEKVIRQLDLTTQPEEIVIDKFKNKAYVSSPEASSIYIIDLATMNLKQKIKVKGMCERLSLSHDGKKMFYTDKKTNDIWAIELDNNYVIKNLGNLPNVSKIEFDLGKVYIASRTKNRVAIVDYATLSPIKEIEVDAKPIDMLLYKDNLYILSAQKNTVQVLNTMYDELTNSISLNTSGFSTKIYRIKDTNLAIITDTKAGKYSVLDLDKKVVIKTTPLEIPVSTIVVANRVKKINR